MDEQPKIRILTRADAAAWRELRIDMLTRDPEGFHADSDEAQHRTLKQWRDSIPAPPGALFGLYVGDRLAGSALFVAEKAPKLAHKGWMLAVYVAPDLRGQGWGGRLVQALIEHARQHVDVLLTGASVAGTPVYRAHGFVTYGIERDASRVNGKSIDDELMAIHFRGLAA